MAVRSRRRFLCVSASLRFVFAIQLAGCAAHAADPALLTEARQALAESIPQVAVQKLKTLLAKPGVPPADRRAAQLELGAAYLAAENDEAALAAVQTLADEGDAAGQLLRAQVFARAGRWKEALALFEELGAPADAPAAARLGLVESRAALGRTAEAVAALEVFVRAQPQHHAAALRLVALLIDAGDAKRARAAWAAVEHWTAASLEQKYLAGRLLLLESRCAEALALFDELLRTPERLTESLLFGAALGASEATLRLHGPDTADTVIEKFIGRHPASRYLDSAFQRLDQIYAQQPLPSETALKQWTKDGVPRVAERARFHTARLRVRAKNPDGALKALNGLFENFPASPLVPGARLLQADLLFAKGDLPGAVVALEDAERRTTDDGQRAEVELRRALVHYRQGEWLLAANSFRGAAERSARLRPHAAYGAALAALALGNHERFATDYQMLNGAAPESPLCSTLLLEQGLARARMGDARAAETLTTFLHHYPEHARQSEARLALAELAFAADDRPGAARYLRVTNESAPSRDTAERAAYLAIFLGDETSAQPADEVAIQRATAFLRDYPRSTLLAEVRMKLGQLHVRAGDHASAETQFTLLAQEQPAGPYAEAALFLAGQSAMRSINPGAVDRALALFDAVVKRDGALQLHARQQQAIVQSKLGRESEAVLLYDAILAATPAPDAELRSAALCGKGDSLLILGRQDPKQLEAAVAAFDQLATLPGVPPAWRNQALYKKGRGLSTLTRTEEALAAWYDVLEKTAPEGRDFFWYYKAGFDAADVFRTQGNWKSAIGIYEKMAKLPGPRADEARERAARLRLEKFLP